MLLLGLRACLNCGSFFANDSLLCLYCEERLQDSDFCELEWSEQKKLAVYSLFDWAPQQSDILSSLLLNLKGRGRKKAWNYWAKVFWLQRASYLREGMKLIFIPAASTSGREDHAYEFAKSLADQSGGELLAALSKTTNSHQKGKNRDERCEVSIGSHVKIAAKCPETLYILVDDVLTTGSTALASFKSLGKPLNFEVWALAKRSLSCEVTMDLL